MNYPQTMCLMKGRQVGTGDQGIGTTRGWGWTGVGAGQQAGQERGYFSGQPFILFHRMFIMAFWHGNIIFMRIGL